MTYIEAMIVILAILIVFIGGMNFQKAVQDSVCREIYFKNI